MNNEIKLLRLEHYIHFLRRAYVTSVESISLDYKGLGLEDIWTGAN